MLEFSTVSSLGTLGPISGDQQGILWRPKKIKKWLGKQPYNNISFKYKP